MRVRVGKGMCAGLNQRLVSEKEAHTFGMFLCIIDIRAVPHIVTSIIICTLGKNRYLWLSFAKIRQTKRVSEVF